MTLVVGIGLDTAAISSGVMIILNVIRALMAPRCGALAQCLLHP
jgi:hypothetical protein